MSKMKEYARSRGHDDDDVYSSSYPSRPTDKKRRSSSSTRSAHKTCKAMPRNLTRQELQEFAHLDIKRAPEPPLAALHPKYSSPAAHVSRSTTSLITARPSLSSTPSCSPLTWATSLSASSSVPDPSLRRPVKADPRLSVSSLRARKPSFLSPPMTKTERPESLSFSSSPRTQHQQQRYKQGSPEPELRLNTSPTSRVTKHNAVVKPKSILKTTGLSTSFPTAPASSTRISMPTTRVSRTEERASFGNTLPPAWPTSALAATPLASAHASNDADDDVDIVLDAGIRPCSSTVYTVYAKHGLQQPASLYAPVSPVSPPDASDHPRAVSAAKRPSSFQGVTRPPAPEPVSAVYSPSKDRCASIGPPRLCYVSKVARPFPPVRSEPASSVHILYMPGWGSAPTTPTSVSRDPRLRSKWSDTLPDSTPASPTTTTTAAAPEQFAVRNSDDYMQVVKATLKTAIHIDGQVALHLALVRPKDLLSCVLDIDTTIAEMEQHLSAGLKIARDVWYLESQPDSCTATQGALWLMLYNTVDTPQSPLTVSSCTSDAIARSEQCFPAVEEVTPLSTADRHPHPHFKDNHRALPLRWSIALAVPQAPHDRSDERRINGLLKFVKAIQFSGGMQQDVFISLPNQRPKSRSSFLPALSFTATSDTSTLVSSPQEIASCTSPLVESTVVPESDKPRQRSRFSSLDDHGYFSDLSDADQHRTPPALTNFDALAPPSSLITTLPGQDQICRKLSKGEKPFCPPPVSSSHCFIDLTASDDDDDDDDDSNNNNSNKNNSNTIDHEQWVPKSYGRFFDATAAPAASEFTLRP